MAEWKTASQTEFPPALAKRLNTFFDRLAECYPDRVVIHFNRDHKKLAERGTELRRLAGYGDDNDKFFSDFGFTYVNALKQKTDSHGTYEDLVARLKAAFPDGIVCLYQAAEFRDDLSYFARKKMRTAKQILKNAGVLRERRPDEVIRPEDDTDDFDAPAKAPAAEKAPAKTPALKRSSKRLPKRPPKRSPRKLPSKRLLRSPSQRKRPPKKLSKKRPLPKSRSRQRRPPPKSRSRQRRPPRRKPTPRSSATTGRSPPSTRRATKRRPTPRVRSTATICATRTSATSSLN